MWVGHFELNSFDENATMITLVKKWYFKHDDKNIVYISTIFELTLKTRIEPKAKKDYKYD